MVVGFIWLVDNARLVPVYQLGSPSVILTGKILMTAGLPGNAVIESFPSCSTYSSFFSSLLHVGRFGHVRSS
jgi:hypothetical protein